MPPARLAVQHTAPAATAAPSVDDRAEGGSVEQRHDPAPGCARAPNIAAGRLRGSCSCGSSLRLLRSEPSAGDVAQAVEVHTVVAHRDQRAVAAAGSACNDLCALGARAHPLGAECADCGIEHRPLAEASTRRRPISAPPSELGASSPPRTARIRVATTKVALLVPKSQDGAGDHNILARRLPPHLRRRRCWTR